MNKYLIEKKYNKQLNIFLGIYITLCLIFALLINGFFVNPKAYTSSDNLQNFNVTFTQNTPNNPDERGSSVFTFSSNLQGNHRGIFIYNEDVIKFAENNISGRLWGEDIDCPLIYVYTDRSDGLNSEKTSSSGMSPNINDMAFVLNDEELNNVGFSEQFLNSYGCVGYYAIKDYGQTIKVDDSFKYVTSYEDLKKYLVDKDDSVVKTDNPFDIPQAPADNSLPLPQQLKFIEGSNKDYATSIDRYLVSVGWNNPQSASFDAYTNIRAEIKYKVKMKAQSGTLFLNKGTYTTDYVDSVFKLADSSISNHYVTKYDSVGYAQPNENIPDANKNPKYMSGIKNYIYQDSLLNNAMLQVIETNHLKYFPLYTYNIIEGTQLSMRYIGQLNGKDYASLWVTVNYSGSAVTKDKITFENASGEPINPNDVDYDNSSDTYTNKDDTWSITGFFQNLSASVSSVFSTISEFFSTSDNGNSSFYKFFSKVFTEFPGFFAMFFIGLGIAIILRIIGR